MVSLFATNMTHCNSSERKVGDTYEPDCLPDHRGPYFAHQEAKLVQRDYRDSDGNLIAPHELYGMLTEGTLFSAQITMPSYIFPGFVEGRPSNTVFTRIPCYALSFMNFRFTICTSNASRSTIRVSVILGGYRSRTCPQTDRAPR